ncbi:MAG: tetratricopeptide repeat protein [Puniceicoccales bacterium]|nr:tetratricopeptide repeat protein [Puniceicoccales bacterium]
MNSEEITKLERKLAQANAAIKQNPTDAAAHYIRGTALAALGRKEGALSAFDKAIELDPRHAPGYNNKGTALAALGRLEEALGAYGKAIELDPGLAAAHNNRGFALAALGHLEEALVAYDKAIRYEPRHLKALINRGIALAALGRKEEAIESYNKAIEYDASLAAAHYNKGNALASLERFDEARESYEKIKNFGLLPNLPRNARDRIIRKFGWWEYDEDFVALAGNDKGSEELRALWDAQYTVRDLLRVTFDEQQDGYIPSAAFYTEAKNFEAMLQAGESEESPTPLRLDNRAAANDPTEGSIFQKFLNKRRVHEDIPQEERVLALHASFSNNPDSPALFKAAAANVGVNDATSVALVFDKHFFADEDTGSFAAQPRLENELRRRESTITDDTHEDAIGESEHLPLYWVLYYDPRTHVFAHTPARCPMTLGFGKTPAATRRSWASERNRELTAALRNVREKYTEAVRAEKATTAWHLLVFLRHLVKDAVFAEEQEMRILSLVRYGTPAVQTHADHLSVDYRHIFDWEHCVREVVVSPKIQNHAQHTARWKNAIKQHEDFLKEKKRLGEHETFEVQFRQSEVPMV